MWRSDGLAIGELVTERLTLQPLRPEDADEIFHVLGDERLHLFIGGQPLSLEALRARFRRLAVGQSPDGEQIWLNWIVRQRSDHAAVGTAQATVTGPSGRQRAQLSWVIGVPWQRRGIASEAACGMVGWLRQRGICALSAHIHPGHTASQRVAARAGLARTSETFEGEELWRSEGGDS